MEKYIPQVNCIVAKQNQRDHMEDRHLVASINSPHHGIIDVVAVFDGHAGAQISNALVQLLPTKLCVALGKLKKFHPISFSQLLMNLFIQIDQLLYQAKLPAGSTAIVGLLHRKSRLLFLVNLGDSRGIVWHDGKLIIETRDHKPASEQARITKAGGFVLRNRVAGNLAVSRAFGDFGEGLKLMGAKYMGPRAPLSSMPDIYIVPLGAHDENTVSLLLASDGLWDVFTSQEVINFFQDTAGGCADIISQAIQRGSGDNITVLKISI